MTNRANLLVVDDTVENLRLLATILGAEGHEVRPITNGRQALIAAERVPPDLFLLDINMPDMNGFELCLQLKAIPALADIPVIFLTALSDIADKVRAFQVGGVDYITKPFQLEEVQMRVRTHLALRRTQIELSANLVKLRAVEALKDDLTQMVVHDMRSPLMALSTHLELLRMEVGPVLNSVAQGDLSGAMAMAKQLAQMANNLLDVNKLQESQMPLELRAHDLAELAKEAWASLEVLGKRHKVELQAAGECRLSCDQDVVKRVFENLLSNAFKHTPIGGCIGVSLKALPKSIRVEVSDEGPGIPLEARERVFEKFASVNKLSASRYHSVGLGLAFCKLAVLAHNGQLGVEGREPQGSVFWFELPSC